MDFEKMKFDCPWENNEGMCAASKMECEEENCAPFHFVEQITNCLHVSVSAELRGN